MGASLPHTSQEESAAENLANATKARYSKKSLEKKAPLLENLGNAAVPLIIDALTILNKPQEVKRINESQSQYKLRTALSLIAEDSKVADAADLVSKGRISSSTDFETLLQILESVDSTLATDAKTKQQETINKLKVIESKTQLSQINSKNLEELEKEEITAFQDLRTEIKKSTNAQTTPETIAKKGIAAGVSCIPAWKKGYNKITNLQKKLGLTAAKSNVQLSVSKTKNHLDKVCKGVEGDYGRLCNAYRAMEKSAELLAKELDPTGEKNIESILLDSMHKQFGFSLNTLNQTTKLKTELSKLEAKFCEDYTKIFDSFEFKDKKIPDNFTFDIHEDITKHYYHLDEILGALKNSGNASLSDITLFLKNNIDTAKNNSNEITLQETERTEHKKMLQVLILTSNYLYDRGHIIKGHEIKALKDKPISQEYTPEMKRNEIKAAECQLKALDSLSKAGTGKWQAEWVTRGVSNAALGILDATLAIGGIIGVPVGATAAAVASGVLTEQMMGVQVNSVISALGDASFEGFVSAVSGINPYFAAAFAVAALIGGAAFIAAAVKLHSTVKEHYIDTTGGGQGLMDRLNGIASEYIKTQMPELQTRTLD